MTGFVFLFITGIVLDNDPHSAAVLHDDVVLDADDVTGPVRAPVQLAVILFVFDRPPLTKLVVVVQQILKLVVKMTVANLTSKQRKPGR